MNLQVWTAVPLLVFAACAAPPAPRPVLTRKVQVQPAPALRVQLVGDVEAPGPQPSRIGRADLDQARALLTRARTELQPSQWELLDRRLAEAEIGRAHV